MVRTIFTQEELIETLGRPGFKSGIENIRRFWKKNSKNESKTIKAVADRIKHIRKEYPPLNPYNEYYDIFACEPKVDIEEFIHRLVVETGLPKQVVAVALYYIEVIVGLSPNYNITQYNTHRMVLVAIILAHKYLIDISFENRYWVKLCGGVYSLKLINEIELEFLKILDFNLNIPDFLWKKTEKEHLEIDINEPNIFE
jgi:hypothetical protein